MTLVSFLVWLLILAVVFGVVFWLLGMIPLPEPLRNLAIGALALILLLILLGALFGQVPLPPLRVGQPLPSAEPLLAPPTVPTAVPERPPLTALA